MPQEDYVLKTQYDALTVPEIQQKYLNHRSAGSIKHRIIVLGLETPRDPTKPARPWTDVEISILQNNYTEMTASRIQELLLPERSVRSIQSKINNLQLGQKVQCGHSRTGKNNPPVSWTAEELVILRNYYGTMKNQELHKTLLPEKTPEQIHNKAKSENLKKYAREPWTEQENQILIENASTHTTKELTNMLPRRTYSAVYLQLKHLHLTAKPDRKSKKKGGLDQA